MQISELFNRHRSIRQYRPDEVDPALVERVCRDAIAGASSSGNLNSISLILTRDPERKQRLYELHFGQPMVLEAPLVITFCADWFRTRRWLRRRGARDNFNNFLSYNVAALDSMIVAQNVALGFEAEGLGICFMGTTLQSMKAIADFLELPDTCLPVTTMVVGYPDENPAKRDRLPLAAFLHDERYQTPSDEQIDQTYEQREITGWNRYMSMPSVKSVIEAKGIKSLAHYYTSEVKYDPDEFQRDSAEMVSALEERHFLP